MFVSLIYLLIKLLSNKTFQINGNRGFNLLINSTVRLLKFKFDAFERLSDAKSLTNGKAFQNYCQLLLGIFNKLNLHIVKQCCNFEMLVKRKTLKIIRNYSSNEIPDLN